MTQQQFIEEIKRLSIAERIALMEAITRSLREDLENDKNPAISGKEIPQADVQNERERKVAAVERLRGIIKFDGEPPTDEGLKEDYANYLTEKYS
ncbi:MAG TPA: hypothetical protein VGC91_18855 [Pyrinomonadaceae bacterium]|jgi:hypothetical protein